VRSHSWATRCQRRVDFPCPDAAINRSMVLPNRRRD
jgi:hypothetical protein